MSGLKVNLAWIDTQALAYAHSLAHLSATTAVNKARTPWGKHSLTLISSAVTFPVGWIDSLAVNQRRQVWFVCAPVALTLFLSRGGLQDKTTLMWMCLNENTVATHELDRCIVLKKTEGCWLSDLSQSILEFPRPHWIMEIINPSGPVVAAFLLSWWPPLLQPDVEVFLFTLLLLVFAVLGVQFRKTLAQDHWKTQ